MHSLAKEKNVEGERRRRQAGVLPAVPVTAMDTGHNVSVVLGAVRAQGDPCYQGFASPTLSSLVKGIGSVNLVCY